MSKFFRRLTISALLAFGGSLFLISASFAQAGGRIALVIGNSHYLDVQRLANPANDARLIAKSLQHEGFKLVGGGAELNLDKEAFDRAVQLFGKEAEGANVALFYYAGHGLQINGKNYLVPVDADPQKEADVDFQMLGADLVLREMEDAHTKLNIVILDACRNNPFEGRGLRALGGGLAEMQAPRGTVISFSTQPGNVALDGDGHDSPYSEALASVIHRPGLDIFRAFNQVGLMVSKVTNGVQQPWVSASPITGDFYFAGAPTPKKNIDDKQRLAFAKASRRDSVESWSKFLSVYKAGYFANLARAARDKVIAQEKAKAAEAQAKALAQQQKKELAAQKAAEKSALGAADRAAKAAALKRAREDAAVRQELKKMADAAAKKAAELAAKLAAQQTAEKFAAEIAAKAPKEGNTAKKGKEVATLAPTTKEVTASPAPALNPSDLVRLLKFHLRQVGCDPGNDMGVWDSRAREALGEFNRYARTHLDVKAPSLNALDVVRGKNQRVCPLVCGQGMEAEGDRCVALSRSHGGHHAHHGGSHSNSALNSRSASTHHFIVFCNGRRGCGKIDTSTCVHTTYQLISGDCSFH